MPRWWKGRLHRATNWPTSHQLVAPLRTLVELGLALAAAHLGLALALLVLVLRPIRRCLDALVHAYWPTLTSATRWPSVQNRPCKSARFPLSQGCTRTCAALVKRLCTCTSIVFVLPHHTVQVPRVVRLQSKTAVHCSSTGAVQCNTPDPSGQPLVAQVPAGNRPRTTQSFFPVLKLCTAHL